MEYLTQNVTELLLRFLVRTVVSMTGTSNSMKYSYDKKAQAPGQLGESWTCIKSSQRNTS